MFSCI